MEGREAWSPKRTS
ncbi:hypothetical protein Mp_5g08850 [Marchantia polymorpha subsp. ruderalis]|uniref:Uncharacterized protein n=1 Tax=Marchantia polymorpha subsp. ruderalis TaxID=1480154 RepID=A0AAF6BGE4_MARPO|nr:hypothetical protein Mp_5g08850 [Marchantia polymorpha subsp. ruderalis]